MAQTDAFSDFDALLAARLPTDPWEHQYGEAPQYVPDYRLLGELLSIPVSTAQVSESGRFAKAIDAWVAQELRRSGFHPDEVWPRATRPRVLPRDIVVLLEKLPLKVADDLRRRLPGIAAVGPVEARVLGRAYQKQVDVCVARWDRGPELLISTKAQLSSFGNNLGSRFEEAYGDAGNLRGRYPLAAVGFLFVQRASVLRLEPSAFERTMDMMRKLRDSGGGNGYTGTALLLVDWDDPPGSNTPVRVREDEVPADIAAPQFFSKMIDALLDVSPVVHHVEVRERRERRHIPVEGSEGESEADGH